MSATGGEVGIVVPVGESTTLRNTVAYAARRTRDLAAETGGTATVHFVYPVTWRGDSATAGERGETAMGLLDRIELWAESDIEPDDDDAPFPPVSFETAIIGDDEYLFSPSDFAAAIEAYAHERGASRVIVDPEYDPSGSAPMLRPMEFELAEAGLAVEEAPVERPARRGVLRRRVEPAQFLAIFGVSYLFYQIIGGFAGGLDLFTGGITAAITAAVLSQVSFKRDFRPLRSAKHLLRFLVYAPYLLWEITKANVSIAYVVLHPSLPIDPELVEFDGAVWGDLPVTTLANSITLTPGTLTVDVTRDQFLIHTLTKSSRDDLLDGGLERAVRFVFYGRSAMRIPSPADRAGPDEEVPADD